MALDALKNNGPDERVLLLGNEAIARGVLDAGVSLVSCYPVTPSSEISATLASLSQDFGFRMEYSANEKVALEVAAGASSYNLT
jgi:indolepyruvate ferredoxin oxidoreductase alpha subunit